MGSFVGKVLTGEGNENTHLVASTLFGTCSTSAGTAAKAVVLENFNALITGVTVHVLFTNSNTAASPTLNVNNTGAKPIYLHGTGAPGDKAITSWSANSVVSFTYDGAAWRMNDTNICTSANFSELADVLEPLMKSYMLNVAWPVGSIYMSVNSTSPATLFGGTWTQLKDRFLLCAGNTYAAGNTGGASTVALETENLPSHSHGLNGHTHSLNGHVHSVPGHTHGLNGHKHSMGSHSHTLNNHTHSLNNHTHTFPKHSHGLNSHTHGIPALSGTAASNGSHGHKANDWLLAVSKNWLKHSTLYGAVADTNTELGAVKNLEDNGWANDDQYVSQNAGAHTHTVTTVASNTSAPNKSSTVELAATPTGGPSVGNTGAPSTANTASASLGDTGGANGNTASSTAFNTEGPDKTNTGASNGNTAATGAGTAHNNMPPYLTVYAWKRTG